MRRRQLYLRGVATLRLEQDGCMGCGMCLAVCPQEVFVMAHGKARISEQDACMECGACMMNCPAGVIWVQSGAAPVAELLLRLPEASAAVFIALAPDEPGVRIWERPGPEDSAAAETAAGPGLGSCSVFPDRGAGLSSGYGGQKGFP